MARVAVRVEALPRRIPIDKPSHSKVVAAMPYVVTDAVLSLHGAAPRVSRRFRGRHAPWRLHSQVSRAGARGGFLVKELGVIIRDFGPECEEKKGCRLLERRTPGSGPPVWAGRGISAVDGSACGANRSGGGDEMPRDGRRLRR